MTSDDTNKMKQNYHTVGTFIKSSRKITERGKIDIDIKERSLSSCHNTGTSIKSGGVKLVVWSKTSEKKMSGDN
jgi:hypothetical protein